MTRIAIVGGGRAATLHAEAAAACRGVELVGVGGRPGTAASLASAMGVPDLALSELAARADGLVLAVPPAATQGVLDQLGDDISLLLEVPVQLDTPDRLPAATMTAVNLLHSATVKKGLQAIAGLGEVHHLQLRGRAVRRDRDTELWSQPFAGAWPVLLAATGTTVEAVSATLQGSRGEASLELGDGRRASALLEWVEPAEAVSAHTELEAAGPTGVVTLRLWPTPTLEVDGRPVVAPDEHPLVALGFVEQIRRFAACCDGTGHAWPPLAVGLGVAALTEAARRSAASAGTGIAT